MNRVFYSKLILFGEYTTLLGGDCLAIPFPKWQGQWEIIPVSHKYTSILQGLGEYVKRIPEISFNAPAFFADVESGLSFVSNIPEGCGCGSSGAVTAAFYERYCQPASNWEEVRAELQKIEGFFHGKSSGTDPLVIYLNTPIHIKSNSKIIVVEVPDMFEVELIDSGIHRSSTTLVTDFLKSNVENLAFHQKMKELQNANKDAIKSLLSYDLPTLISTLKSISKIQYHHLNHLIAETIKQDWLMSLQSDKVFYKLNGAGGGGYYQKLTIKNEV